MDAAPEEGLSAVMFERDRRASHADVEGPQRPPGPYRASWSRVATSLAASKSSQLGSIGSHQMRQRSLEAVPAGGQGVDRRHGQVRTRGYAQAGELPSVDDARAVRRNHHVEWFWVLIGSPVGRLQRGGGGIRGRSGILTGRGRSQGSYTHAGSGLGGGQQRSISARNAASRERSRTAAG